MAPRAAGTRAPGQHKSIQLGDPVDDSGTQGYLAVPSELEDKVLSEGYVTSRRRKVPITLTGDATLAAVAMLRHNPGKEAVVQEVCGLQEEQIDRRKGRVRLKHLPSENLRSRVPSSTTPTTSKKDRFGGLFRTLQQGLVVFCGGRSWRDPSRNTNGIVGAVMADVTGSSQPTEPVEEIAKVSTSQSFPDYVPLTGDIPDEGKMLSLEDPYPCRFGSVTSLSRMTRECKRKGGSSSEGACVKCLIPFQCPFWL